ncbi:C-terminal binding protein, partial [Arthrobacter sp. 35/47]|uniref:C-terminal binding protein n=1 Tax=Arthrobacter sp. 35/47 TaxID=269454 RepID=UPI00068903E1
MRVVITDHNFTSLDDERSAAAALDAEFEVNQVTTQEAARNAVRGADVVLVNFAPITAKVLDAMPAEGVVIRYGIGYDNVDLHAANERGISVCNVPDYGADTVADHTLSLIFVLVRKIVQFDRVLSSGGWISPPSLAPIRASADTTIGLIGLGRIGLGVVTRLKPFGFPVLAFDPFIDPAVAAGQGIELVDMDTIFRRAHVISLHAPATPDTYKVVNAENLRKMLPASFIVNTARGSLVDQDAVLAALETGQLAGAALDVFDPEPLPTDHGLRNHSNAILTPHAAFYSEASLAALQRLAAEEVYRA